MKRILTAVLAVTIACLMAFLGAAQVFAQNAPAGEPKEYIGEVKVATGGSAESDLKAEGFTILRDDEGDPST